VVEEVHFHLRGVFVVYEEGGGIYRCGEVVGGGSVRIQNVLPVRIFPGIQNITVTVIGVRVVEYIKMGSGPIDRSQEQVNSVLKIAIVFAAFQGDLRLFPRRLARSI
jgi:hypothetical protein